MCYTYNEPHGKRVHYTTMEMEKVEQKIEKIEEKTKPKKKKENNSQMILVIVVLILGIVLGLVIVFWPQLTAKKPQSSTEPLGEQTQKPEFDFSFKGWEDPAGFSFEYPDELKVDVHPDDESNYSFLTFTSEKFPGKLEITCNDTQYKDVAEWGKEDSLVKQASGLETKIADLPAYKVVLGQGREIMAVIDWDEVIYILDKTPGEDKEENLAYWGEIYSHLLDSFKLIPLEGETEEEFTDWMEGFDTVGIDVVEQVEVIE